MDGYLAKPVELGALLHALDRWLPLPETAAAMPMSTPVAAVTATTDAAEPEPIDRTKLAEISMGDAEFEREMLTDFRETADADAEQLAAALGAEDFDAIARIAHRIKGASRAVGAVFLADVSEDGKGGTHP